MVEEKQEGRLGERRMEEEWVGRVGVRMRGKERE